MTVTHLLWDMDGTLLDSGVAVPAAYVAAVRRLGGPAVTPEQVIDAYPIGPPAVMLSHLTGREVTPADLELYYAELAHVTVSPYRGVLRTMARLRVIGQPVAVFTGASARAAAFLLPAAGIEPDVLVGGDEVGSPKPSGDGIELAARRLGVAPDRLAYVGDAPNDMRAARAAGALSAAAAWGHQYDPAEKADVTLARPVDAVALLRAG